MLFQRSVACLAVTLSLPLLGCGGSATGAIAGAGSATDAAVPPSSRSDAAADAGLGAVQTTIQNSPACTALPAFYWEIGDVNGALASGAVGTTFSATTAMDIASASKLIFGAYVVERFKSDLSMIDTSSMRMLSGYTSLSYDSCVLTKTVNACLTAAGNGVHSAAEDGLYHYNGGHFQKYAVALGLGDDTNAKLESDIKSLVGPELAFTYASPQLHAGVRTTPTDYGAFLRKILAGKLAIHDHLGEKPVCTLPSSCSAASYSPVPLAWHYSYAHWVEDEPQTGDGAFSSPGAFGFYPWIDASKTYYGILARYALGANAYLESADCGRLLRKAFLTGAAAASTPLPATLRKDKPSSSPPPSAW